MKYNTPDTPVPPQDRATLNHRIVNLILAGNTRDLDPTEVYHQFTGKGALHGLQFKDFDSHHAYAQAKKQFEHGQFFTPDTLCADIIATLSPPPGSAIADITCGKGNFFNHLPEDAAVYGNELDPDAFEVCRYLFPNVQMEQKDFLYYDPGILLDIVVGNPPFNLHTDEGTSQFAFVKKSRDLLKPGGILAFIVPMSFLADEFQDKQKITWINEHYNFITQCALPSNSFDVAIDTKLMILQRKGFTNSNKPYSPWESQLFEPQTICTTLLQPLYEQNHKDRIKNKRLAKMDPVRRVDIDYAIRRRLWHIKEHPQLCRKYYHQAQRKLAELKTQVKPKGMADKDWQRVRLTPEKILDYVNGVVCGQNDPRPAKVIKLVKNQYGITWKAYHPALKKREKKCSVHDLLLRDDWVLGPYQHYFHKKSDSWKSKIPPTKTSLPALL